MIRTPKPQTRVSQHAIRERASALTQAFAHALEGMVYLDPDLVVRAANRPASRQLGHALPELLDRPGPEIAPDWLAAIRSALNSARETREGQHLRISASWSGSTTGGTPLWDVSIAPLLSPPERFLGWLIIQHTADSASSEQIRQLTAAFASVPEPVLIWDSNGSVVQANRAMLSTFGVDPVGPDRAALIQRLALRHPDGRPFTVDKLPGSRALQGQNVVGEQILLQDSQGRDLVLQAKSAPLREGDEITGAIVTWENVTERQRLLAEMETVFASVAGPLIVYDRAGTVVRANPAARAMYGSDVLGGDAGSVARGMNLRHPDGRPLSPDELPPRRALGGEIVSGERYLITDSSGEERAIAVTVSPLWINERIEGAVGAWQDVTEQEHLLTELDAIFTAVPEPVAVYDLNGRLLRANPAACDTFGLRAGEDDHQAIWRRLAVRHLTGQPLRHEDMPVSRILRGEPKPWDTCLLRDAEGRERIAVLRAAPLRRRGKTYGVVAVWQEVTERERLLAEVERRVAELDAVIAAIPDALMIFDQAGRLPRVNPAGERLFTGIPALSGLPVAEQLALVRFQRPEGSPFHEGDLAVSRALRGEVVQGQIVVAILPNGVRLDVSVSAAPIHATDDRLLGAVAVYTDVSQLLELQQQREEYIGLITHDLRNPLTSILGYAQRWQRRAATADMTEAAGDAAVIASNARRMAAMLDDLVETVRLQSGRYTLDCQPVDSVALLADIAGQVGRPEDRERIRLETLGEPPWVSADRAHLERAVVNVLTNALKYAPAGTPVRMTARPAGTEIVISVADQGEGIPSHELPLLFERYYRAQTGKKADGLGLGLYIARMIVEAHGGRIWAESEAGKGSTFNLALPALKVD